MVSVRWLSLLLGVVAGLVCSSASWANDAAGGFLWKVEKQGEPVSYVIGTIHLGQTNSVLPKSYLAALQKSKVLMVESNADDWQGLQGMALYVAMQNLMYDPQTLAANIGAERVQRLNRLLQQNGGSVRLDAQANMAPWMAFMLVATDYNMPGYSVDAGIDVLLMQAAQQQKKHIEALETLEPMLAFQRIPKSVLLRAMDASVANQHQNHAEQLLLLQQYHQGKSLEFVTKTMDAQDSVKLFPKQDQMFWRQWLFGDMLQQRNSRWLPKMVFQIKQQPTVIAVGAAHLYGGSGVLNLLRERGYRVEPVAAHF